MSGTDLAMSDTRRDERQQRQAGRQRPRRRHCAGAVPVPHVLDQAVHFRHVLASPADTKLL
eukprot:658622-Rhodomonas_salina.2